MSHRTRNMYLKMLGSLVQRISPVLNRDIINPSDRVSAKTKYNFPLLLVNEFSMLIAERYDVF